ncbi:MAG: GDP-mannose 4,6-dehydratase [Bacteriovoracia bacterium]
MSKYLDQNVLITGGAGFVGSNLAHFLVNQGAKVTIVDNFHPEYGGNEHNLTEIKNKIELIRFNIVDRQKTKDLIISSKPNWVFHIAAQCSHVDSMIDPFFDVEYNSIGTLAVLEGCKALSKETGRSPIIVYAGTRAMIGQPLERPAKETTLPNPTDVYGVNKLAAEWYGAVYARVHQIPFVSLRLTNSFGPRHQMKNGKYGILNWFISLALQNKPITVYGKGEQLRDYLYITDAVEAFAKAGEFGLRLVNKEVSDPTVQLSGPSIPFATFNIASGRAMPFGDAVKAVTGRTNTPLQEIPWPADRKAIETGDFVADCSAAAKHLNWTPKVSYEDGLDQTIAFYREHLKHYI